MYLPRSFEVADPAFAERLVRSHALATLMVVQEGEPVVNHIPFVWDGPQRLLAHVAKANPLWKVAGPHPLRAVAVFQGPQAYVTPSWYPTKAEHGKVVPTWNYAVAHAHGQLHFVHDRAVLRAWVERLTDAQEGEREGSGLGVAWKVSDAPADYLETMLGGIVGVELQVQRWELKAKLSQNHAPAQQEGVRQGALQQGGAAADMARWMPASPIEPPASA